MLDSIVIVKIFSPRFNQVLIKETVRFTEYLRFNNLNVHFTTTI